MKKLFIILAFILASTSCATDPFDIPKLPIPSVITEVNDKVNQLPYETDKQNWGQKDYWATPKEFYARRRGDCEDYAIAKYFALRKIGIPASQLLLTAGIISGGGHMILLYKDKGIIYVLDNIEKDVAPLNNYMTFHILYLLNENNVIIGNVKYPAQALYKWNQVLRRMAQGK